MTTLTSWGARRRETARVREIELDIDLAGARPPFQLPEENPMEAYARRRLWEHEEVVAYSRGRGMFLDGCSEDIALRAGAIYLKDDPDHGARLAALVLAGFVGIHVDLG